MSDDLEKLKRIQLEMLIEVDKVCRKYDIKYTLSSGTLLGAVRHHGFIPWDDDIDIAMTLENYNKFLEVAQEELPKHLFVQNYLTEKDCPFVFTKVVNTNTVFIDGVMNKINIVKGVGLDLFPISGLREKDKDKKSKIYKYVALFISKYYDPEYFAFTKKRKIFNALTPTFKLNTILKYYFKHIAKLDELGKEITNADFLSANKYFDYDLFTEYVDIQFENYKFMAIKRYDDYLSTAYGDYMTLPPEDKRSPHHDYLYFNAEKSYADYLINNTDN